MNNVSATRSVGERLEFYDYIQKHVTMICRSLFALRLIYESRKIRVFVFLCMFVYVFALCMFSQVK